MYSHLYKYDRIGDFVMRKKTDAAQRDTSFIIIRGSRLRRNGGIYVPLLYFPFFLRASGSSYCCWRRTSSFIRRLVTFSVPGWP